MRTFAGISVVLLLEVAALAVAVAWRRRTRQHRDRSQDGRHLTAVLEVEDGDAPLPSGTRCLPLRIPAELLADPMLGLADVRVVHHVQPTGAGLPERSQVGASYQGLNESVAKTVRPMPGEPPIGPVPAVRLTWLALRLELPGSRNAAWAERARGPIKARGGGADGAARTLDKAVRTSVAKLNAAGFEAATLAEAELRVTLAASVSVVAGGGDGGIGDAGGGRLGGPAGLGRHTPDGTSALADQPVGPGGLVIGLDPSHQPLLLALFRRRPLTVGVVGGLRLAQILALRGAAVGARVIVETARQELWDPLLLDSGLDAARLAIQPVGRVTGNPGWAPPSPAAPILVVRDCGARPPYATTPRGPWTTILTLLPYLDVRAAGQLATADLVGLQRMSAEEAGVARQAVGLSDKDTLALPELPESMALWRVRGRAGRYCEVTATAWEERIVADPVPARATASPAR